MSQAWFRMYSTFMGDPVVQSLSFDMQRHYVIVLCIKADGILDRKVAKGVREIMITKALGVTESEKISIKKALKDAALVDDNWQPAGWGKRQYKSDDSTHRVRKYRKNKETGNVSVTENETAEETLQQERYRNVPRARATETETDKPPIAPLARGARGSRLPPDWSLPDDWRAWAESEGMTQSAIDRQADQFADYWHAQPGTKGRKADWLATWRNWIRRDLPARAKQRATRTW